jgi:hypothetical protein
MESKERDRSGGARLNSWPSMLVAQPGRLEIEPTAAFFTRINADSPVKILVVHHFISVFAPMP